MYVVNMHKTSRKLTRQKKPTKTRRCSRVKYPFILAKLEHSLPATHTLHPYNKKLPISYPVPHSRHRLAVADPSPNPFITVCNLQNCKTTCPKVGNEILNIVHVQFILHLLKTRTTMDNIFLSHSYILVFPPKSLFSITLTLICITLCLVTLLGNHFSFHFIALLCKRNVISLLFQGIFSSILPLSYN